MVEDPVYQGFVLPAYVAVEQRAEAEAQARQQVEADRQVMARQLQEAEKKLKQAGLL